MALPSSNIEEFRAVLRAAKHIIVVAGAGLSAASGLVYHLVPLGYPLKLYQESPHLEELEECGDLSRQCLWRVQKHLPKIPL